MKRESFKSLEELALQFKKENIDFDIFEISFEVEPPKEIRFKVLIDFEFTGLPRWGYWPEITEVKAMNLTSGKTVVRQFKTDAPIQMGAQIKAPVIPGEKYFSKEEFAKILTELRVNPEKTDFIGFGFETDEKILARYGISLNYTEDIRWTYILQHQEETAFHGNSMEVIASLIKGRPTSPSHSGEEELHELFNIYKNTRGECPRILKIYPWGDDAGRPLKGYVEETYYKKISGYINYNYNPLAESLDFYQAALAKDKNIESLLNNTKIIIINVEDMDFDEYDNLTNCEIGNYNENGQKLKDHFRGEKYYFQIWE